MIKVYMVNIIHFTVIKMFSLLNNLIYLIMKNVIVISVIAISLGLLIPVNAQMHGDMVSDSAHCQGIHKCKMHSGQMGNMKEEGRHQNKSDKVHGRGMNNMMPERQLMPYMALVERLPGMQQPLGLTDDQVSKLVDLRAAFAKQKVDLKADLAKKELKIKDLLKNNASGKEIGDHLTACAASRISIAVSAYETANKMKSILNDSQKQKLNEFIEKFHQGKGGQEECCMGK
jgi:hypothetical protein